jgi:hypothetical protein
MTRTAIRAIALLSVVVAVGAPRPTFAQQSIGDVLSFLLTNRSIPTDDFSGDEEAAARTSETISSFLLVELATLPITSSAGGFSYRLDPGLGTMMRSSDSFGPFFAERSLTIGRRQSSFGLSFQSSTFDNIDGQDLRDGTLVSTASRLRTDPAPFDVETVSLHIRTDTMTIAGTYGVTDRLDLSGAVPLVRLQLSGQRVDTYRGQRLPQATGSGTTSGIGDLVLRAKYNLARRPRGGVAVGGELRLPTGDSENLLGAGEAAVKPRVIGSFENERVGLHGDVGYWVGGLARELDYGAALTVVAASRLTLVAELSGRRFGSFGRLAQTVEPHPRLVNVESIRLTSMAQTTDRLLSVVGFKWNVGRTWMVSANVRHPLTTSGLNAAWIPTLTLDYSFQR